MWFPHLGNSQVYNYEAISFYNVETNPSVLTSDKKDNIFKLVQKNSLSKNQPFSYTKASYSSHLNSDFFGVGITLNNTDQGKGASYRYAGIGVGYRNVILSKVLLKVGATYKTIHSSKGGDFGYYEVDNIQTTKGSMLSDQLNLSISFTENAERYYITLSSLNLELPWNKSSKGLSFSRYYLVNIGGLGALIDAIPFRGISYDGMSRYDIKDDKWVLSHYINFRYQVPITRKMSAFFGLKAGYLESIDFHFMPFITLFKEAWSLNVMYNFHLDDRNFNVSNISTIQTSIFFKL